MLQGRVLINGQAAQPGDQADPAVDRIEVDGRLLPAPSQGLTLLLHKPRGVHATCHDPRGRRTVLDLLPQELARGTSLHPVGRLDADSRGALLLSNIGELTLALTHPRYQHPTRYLVWVAGNPSPAALHNWRQGVELDGQPSRPVQVDVLQRSQQRSLLELELREGRNRQIRRTAELLGHPVLDLLRVAIGPIQLGQLEAGDWRWLQPQEEQALSTLITLANGRELLPG